MSKAILLCYNLKDKRAKAIQFLAVGMGIHPRLVKPEEYAQSLLSLLGFETPGEAVFTGEGFEDEMLVMANFPSPLINRFLDTFRHTKVPSVKLKALLTQTNGGWDSQKLHDELVKENAAMAQLRAQAQAKKAEEAK
jgi:hypothetical protein